MLCVDVLVFLSYNCQVSDICRQSLGIVVSEKQTHIWGEEWGGGWGVGVVLLACQCLGWSTGGRPGDKVPGSSRPFQERRAITCACAHAKVFRRVINHMRK